MKLVLTSGGVTDPGIRSALVQLLGKPISELLVDGGDATYVCHWMRESELAICCLRCPKPSGWE